MAPLVSILLPSKNPGLFLKERIRSILDQTLTDWELIIVDSSTDGSLEVFQDLLRRDKRVTLYQRPPGLYQAWNFAIRQAKGKYVYIATADDTMRNDALEKMAAALESHPECGLCDSLLQLIDAESRLIREFAPSYLACDWHLSYPKDRMHIRKKPSDFFVHLGGKTVYTSITQLMIRRSLFEKTGPFPENYGSSADYLWGMRAALHSDVIFLPEYLASWRIHDAQATFAFDAEKVQNNFFLMTKMVQEVLKEAPPEIAGTGKKISSLVTFKGILWPAKRHPCSLLKKIALLGQGFFYSPRLMMEFLLTLPVYRCRIPAQFVFIYTYARMIRRHTKRFYQGKIEFCDTALPGSPES